jgi:hypothetical protein
MAGTPVKGMKDANTAARDRGIMREKRNLRKRSNYLLIGERKDVYKDEGSRPGLLSNALRAQTQAFNLNFNCQTARART